VRAFPVRLPSGVRYWTVLNEDLAVVAEADAFLRHVRFGRDGSELTTRSYAGAIALFLRWCVRTGMTAWRRWGCSSPGCATRDRSPAVSRLWWVGKCWLVRALLTSR
jgi:hypothetical protein